MRLFRRGNAEEAGGGNERVQVVAPEKAEQAKVLREQSLVIMRQILQEYYEQLFGLRSKQNHLPTSYTSVIPKIANTYADSGEFPSVLHAHKTTKKFGFPGIFSDDQLLGELSDAGFNERTIGLVFDGSTVEQFLENHLVPMEKEIVRDIVVNAVIEHLDEGNVEFNRDVTEDIHQAISWLDSNILPEVPAVGEVSERLIKKITEVYAIDPIDSPRVQIAMKLDQHRATPTEQLIGYHFAYYTASALLKIKAGQDVSDNWLNKRVNFTANRMAELYEAELARGRSSLTPDDLLEEANMWMVEAAIRDEHSKATLNGDHRAVLNLERLGKKTAVDGLMTDVMRAATTSKLRQMNPPRKRPVSTHRATSQAGGQQERRTAEASTPKRSTQDTRTTETVDVQAGSIKKPSNQKNETPLGASGIKISLVDTNGDRIDPDIFKAEPTDGRKRSSFVVGHFANGRLNVRTAATVGFAASAVVLPATQAAANPMAPESVNVRVDYATASDKSSTIDMQAGVSTAAAKHRSAERSFEPSAAAVSVKAESTPASTADARKATPPTENVQTVAALDLADTTQAPGIRVDVQAATEKSGFLANRDTGRLVQEPVRVLADAVSPEVLGATAEQSSAPGIRIEVAQEVAKQSGRAVTAQTMYASALSKPMGQSPAFAATQEAVRFNEYLESSGVTFKDKVTALEGKHAERGLARVETQSQSLVATLEQLTTLIDTNQGVDPSTKERYAKIVAAINYPASFDNVGDTFDASLLELPKTLGGNKLTAAETAAYEKYVAAIVKERLESRAIFAPEDLALGYGNDRAVKALMSLAIANLTIMNDKQRGDIVEQYTPKAPEQLDTEEGGEKTEIVPETAKGKNAVIEHAIKDNNWSNGKDMFMRAAAVNGWSSYMTAFVGGNVEHESGFNMTIIEKRPVSPDQVGFGYYQATGDRRVGLVDFVKDRKVDPFKVSQANANLQLERIEIEMKDRTLSKKSKYHGRFDSEWELFKWMEANNRPIEEAAKEFMVNFERPRNMNQPSRGTSAADIRNDLNAAAKKVGGTKKPAPKPAPAPAPKPKESAPSEKSEGKLHSTNRGEKVPDEYAGLRYYNQHDNRWDDKKYAAGGDGGTISESGCGATAIAMVITNLIGRDVLPTEIATLNMKRGFKAPNNGTAWAAFTEVPEDYGLKAKRINKNKAAVKAVLDRGGLILIAGKDQDSTTPATKSGHIYVLRDMTDAGKLKILDPNSFALTKDEFDPNSDIFDAASILVAVEKR